MRGHHVGLDYHRGLLDDPWRLDAYDRALRQLIRPGDVVLDLGSGTGILSMLAARRGARVHAVESAAIGELSVRLIAENGLSDRITVHHADAVELDPVEPVDWVVSDFMGRFLVDDAMLDAVEAAGRWCKPTARFIPKRVTLKLAPVGDFSVPMVERWRTPLLGLSLTAGHQASLHSCYHTRLGARAVLAPPQPHAVMTPPTHPALSSTHRFSLQRSGRLMGVAGFFTAELAPGVQLHTAPGFDTHWGQYLFPLEPRQVEAGESLDFALSWKGGRWNWHSGRDAAHSEMSYGGALEERPPRGDRAAAITASDRGAAAYAAGDLHAAVAHFEEAVAQLRPEDDDIAPALYENLGLGYLNTARSLAAVQALLRGEGGPQQAARAQWLRVALERAGRTLDLARLSKE